MDLTVKRPASSGPATAENPQDLSVKKPRLDAHSAKSHKPAKPPLASSTKLKQQLQPPKSSPAAVKIPLQQPGISTPPMSKFQSVSPPSSYHQSIPRDLDMPFMADDSSMSQLHHLITAGLLSAGNVEKSLLQQDPKEYELMLMSYLQSQAASQITGSLSKSQAASGSLSKSHAASGSFSKSHAASGSLSTPKRSPATSGGRMDNVIESALRERSPFDFKAKSSPLPYLEHSNKTSNSKHNKRVAETSTHTSSEHMKIHTSVGGRVKHAELVVPNSHTVLKVPETKFRQRRSTDAPGHTPAAASSKGNPSKSPAAKASADKSRLFPYSVNSVKTPTASSPKANSANHHSKSNGHLPHSKATATSLLNGIAARSPVNGESYSHSRSVEIQTQTQSYLPAKDSATTARSLLSTSTVSSASSEDGGSSSSSKKSRRKQERPLRVRREGDRALKEVGVNEDREINDADSDHATGEHNKQQRQDTVNISNELLKSEELLNKVTDAAQNGELKRGLDAIFGETGQRASEARNDDDDDDDDDMATDDGSFSSSASPVTVQSQGKLGLSPKKQGTPHASTATLQNRERRKRLRMNGKAYTTPSGKVYPQRKVQDKDCSKCRYNCSVNVTPEQRQQIFDHFWGLDAYVKRLYYYCQSIKEKPAKTMKHTRECSREYTFKLDTGERVRVCKGFYLATLDVSDKAVRIAMEKRKRGKCLGEKRNSQNMNKGKMEEMDRARCHIETNVIADIYAKTVGDGENSELLPGQGLNVAKLYQDYVRECGEENREQVSEDLYSDAFTSDFDLSSVQV